MPENVQQGAKAGADERHDDYAAMVGMKVAALETMSTSQALRYQWQSMDIKGDEAGQRLRQFRLAAFAEIADSIGLKAFEAAPAALLNQVAITALLQGHQVGRVFDDLMLNAMTAYAHPTTHEEAFSHITQLDAMKSFATGEIEVPDDAGSASEDNGQPQVSVPDRGLVH